MNYTSNMGMNMPDENDKFSIEHFNTNTQALDIVGKPDEYKNTKTYAVGDLCIHNNILYKCIIAVETAEEFNAEKWEVTSLCKEEIANKTAIAELNEKIDSGIHISNELQTITLPFTAQSNVMMQIKITHILDDIGHYCYLRSDFYGNNYYSFVGASRGGMTSEWFPVKKGDTISFQGASGATATYAVFS